jgi:lambda family phage minor tail protein L
MRSIHANLVTEKNKQSSASSWLTLLDVVVSSSVTLYLTPNPASVAFDSLTYSPFALTVSPVGSDSKGGLPDVEVTVQNVSQVISAYLEANDMRGQRVRLRIVHSDNLADATRTAFDESYEITGISVTELAVTFLLSHLRLLDQRFPGGRFLRDNCRWLYKSTECGYVGALATCDKILEGTNGCRAHANQTRFGGFPGLVAVGGRFT